VRAAAVLHLGAAQLELIELAEPSCRPGEVLIEVHAAGVSFPDLLMAQGRYQTRPPLPFVPGGEVAGTVRDAATDGRFAVGDRVVALPGLGGFAEVVACPADRVFALPAGVSFRDAAALPINYLTMQFALMRRARLAFGEVVLVHGAAGGIGTAAIQIATSRGARVIAVTSSDAKAAIARSAGAGDVVSTNGFLGAVRDLTDGQGVDVVVDPVGGDRFPDSIRSLAPEGRLLVIGFTNGKIPTVAVNRLLLRNIDLVGVAWGSFWRQHVGYLQQQWDDLMPQLATGAVAPLIGEVRPLASAGETLRAMAERRLVGKAVVAVR
jgi:NADPH2:quinone reductase